MFSFSFFLLVKEEGMEMRRKENSFLRLQVCGSRNGAGKPEPNTTLLLLLFSFDLRGKGRGKRVKQGRNGIEKGPCF